MEDKDKKDIIDDKNGRRIYRRRRRIRNQILAYLVALLLVAGLVVGVDYGIKLAMEQYRAWQEAEEEEPEQPPIDIVEEDPYPEDEDENGDGGEEEEEPPDDDPVPQLSELDIFVEDKINEMSLEHKIAGLFFITPDSLTGASPAVRAGSATEERMQEYPVGGLIYFAGNIQSRNQLTEMLANTRSYSPYPIFLAVDEEGGSVARIARSNLAENVGPMGDIGANGDLGAAFEAGQTIGEYLSELGFDTNFAPVADVLADADNQTIGNRSFGTDASMVADMVAAFIGGAKEAGIRTSAKHFPGLGGTTVDTHVGMATSERTLEEMRSFELLPFIAAIESGVEFIMLGHLLLPAISGDDTPASLSSIIVTDLLREELGFGGIIITDALNMGALNDYASAEASIIAIKAGVDMLLMPANFIEAYNGLLEAVTSGEISEERINESLRRIFRVKYSIAD
ncbi:MAG: beta-N-acetylhexosaminidase [Lachnospiraceae bacterium]|nr:beta-N-acetylhexosaminidase [Lachnospiraceae bacterium]